MIRRPPRSTRTDTLFPYTTLCRSLRATVRAGTSDIFSFDHDAWIGPEPRDAPSRFGSANVRRGGFERRRNDAGKFESAIDCESWAYYGGRSALGLSGRSEERRVGKGCGSTWRSRVSAET